MTAITAARPAWSADGKWLCFISNRALNTVVKAPWDRGSPTLTKRLCWIDEDPSGSEKNGLGCVDIANKGDKPERLMEGVTGFELSADGKKMMVHTMIRDKYSELLG